MISIKKNQIAVADNNNPNDLLIKITILPDDKGKWQYLYITQEELQNLVEVLKVFNNAYNKLK